MHTRTLIGKDAESYVATYLQKAGFTILARNYTKRYGEIDLIAHKKETISFVEVKVRTTVYFELEQLISANKQRKIIAVAKEYIAHNNITDKICRFDVALLEYRNDSFDLSYIPNAFVDENR